VATRGIPLIVSVQIFEANGSFSARTATAATVEHITVREIVRPFRAESFILPNRKAPVYYKTRVVCAEMASQIAIVTLSSVAMSLSVREKP
jgi:hypothetical protein